VSAGGAVQWSAGGLALGPTFSEELVAGLTPVASGGAMAVWMDGSGSSWDLRAQRATGAGALEWGAAGLVVCGAAGIQEQPVITGDGFDGALVAWQDERSLPADEIAVQRIGANGDLLWASGGLVATLTSLVSARWDDGAATIVWQSAPSRAVTIERAVGGAAWAPIGSSIADGTGRIEFVDRELAGVARAGWRLRLDGAIAGEVWLDLAAAPHFALDGVRPNPAPHAITMSLEVPAIGAVRAEVLDVAGRVVWRRTGSFTAGRHEVRLEGSETLPPALYFLRVTRGSASATTRFVKID